MCLAPRLERIPSPAAIDTSKRSSAKTLVQFPARMLDRSVTQASFTTFHHRTRLIRDTGIHLGHLCGIYLPEISIRERAMHLGYHIYV